jgi:hypothetical protein
MYINLSPMRMDDSLVIVKSGDTLIVNGVSYNFSPIGEGDTLPATAFNDYWFEQGVGRVDGELRLSIRLPNPWNYSQAQAFPTPLVDVPDGRVVFPSPLPDDQGNYAELPPIIEPVVIGFIDWTKMITKEMKEAEALAEKRAADVIREDAWRVAEITIARDNLDGILFEDPNVLPGTETQWKAYGVRLRAWKEGALYFPDSTKRPTRPT